MHPFNAWNEVKVTQTCPTLCNPIDYTVQGTLQAGILEWVLFPFSRVASQPRDRTQVSHNCRWILYQLSHQGSPFNAYQTPNTEPARWRWEANSEREKEQTKKMSCPQGGELINKWAKRMKAAHGRRQLLQIKRSAPPCQRGCRRRTCEEERGGRLRTWHPRCGREQAVRLEWQGCPLQPKPTGGRATQNTAVREEEIPSKLGLFLFKGKPNLLFCFHRFQRCKNFCLQWIWLNFHFKFDKSVRELGFPGGARENEPGCQCRRRKRHAFDPWVGKIIWNGAWQPTPIFLPGESQGQRSLVGYGPWDHRESDMTEAT